MWKNCRWFSYATLTGFLQASNKGSKTDLVKTQSWIEFYNPMHEITAGHWSLSGTISCVIDRIRFLPVTMTGRFSNVSSISYTEDRHELRVTVTKCRLPDKMSGTSEIFISGAVSNRWGSFKTLNKNSSHCVLILCLISWYNSIKKYFKKPN